MPAVSRGGGEGSRPVSRPRRSRAGVGRAATPVLLAILFLFATPVLGGTVSLRWDAVPDQDVGGYKVYWGTSPGSHDHVQDVGNVTSTTIAGLANCTTWYFAVRAYDTGGLESPEDSNRVVGWPRPEITAVSPGVIEQGETVTFTISGTNFYPGEAGNPSRPPARVRISWPGVVVRKTEVESCTRIRVTVEAADDADLGWVTLTVENPDLTWDDPADHPWVWGSRSRAFEVQRRDVDETPPTVRGSDPADGATGVPATVRPVVTFSEAVAPSSVTPATVQLLDEDGRAVAQDLGSPRTDGATVTIVPANPLAEGKAYRIHVRGGAGGVTDLAGNPMAEDWDQSTGFRIAGGESPEGDTASVQDSNPRAGQQDVPVDVTEVSILFDRDVSPLASILSPTELRRTFSVRAGRHTVALAGAPRFRDGGRRVVLSLAEPLESGRTYRTCARLPRSVTPSRMSEAGHPELMLAPWCTVPGWKTANAITSIGYVGGEEGTISGELTPAAAGHVPLENTNVPVDAVFRVTFAWPVAPSSASSRIFMIVHDGRRVELAAEPELEDDDHAVVLRPADPLLPGERYVLRIRTGAGGVQVLVDGEPATIGSSRGIRVPFTTEVSGDTPAARPGLAGLAGLEGRSGRLRIAWGDVPGSLLAGYDVELLDAEGNIVRVLDVGRERTALLTALEDGREYRVRVRPYDRFGNRARHPSAELVTLPAPEVREVEGTVTPGRASWLAVRGANFADGAEVRVRRTGVRVLEAAVISHDLINLQVVSADQVTLEPADIVVVNPVPKAEDYLRAYPEVLDLDGSGKVDPGDLAPVESFFGVTRGDPRYRLRWDPNGDGVIDGEDRALLEERLSRRRPGKAGKAVEEGRRRP